MPNIVKLAQNTPEWHEWREKHLGGSDAGAVMFLGYKDRYRLWQEKTKRVQPEEPWGDDWSYESPAQRGLRLEPEARTQYSIQTGRFAPATCIENSRPGEEFMAASLDGYEAGDRIQEFKCPTNPRTHLDAKEGIVEPAYRVQCQHNMHCAEVERCDYCSYFNGELVIQPIFYDKAYCEAQLVPAERLLWSCIQNDMYPFPEGEIDVRDVGLEGERMLVETFLKYQRMLEEASRYREEAYAALKCAFWDVRTVKGVGAILQWVPRRGFIRYKNLPVVQELIAEGSDLNPWRGPDTLSLRIDRS